MKSRLARAGFLLRDMLCFVIKKALYWVYSNNYFFSL